MKIYNHPLYEEYIKDWMKWRLAYNGGDNFVKEYLEKLSAQESDDEFKSRKKLTYVPRFAGSAIDDIKNSIFQRISDVKRVGGPKSYQSALGGDLLGVDLNGSTMDSFIGQHVLPELLVMGQVGVLTDNFADLGTTVADKGNRHPYFSVFQREQIVNWAPAVPVNGYDVVLLLEDVEVVDENYGLPVSHRTRHRLYRKVPEGVEVTFFKQVILQDNRKEHEIESTTILDIEQVPFTMFSLKNSLMENVADYQIALMNIESSDVAYARKANFPLYYEFFFRDEEGAYHSKPSAEPGTTQANDKKKIEVGMTTGRRFPEGLEKPGFINPDPETLRVSIEKGKQIKEDIRNIINLNLMSMNPRRQSADSKEIDSRSLEASLSFIGLVLSDGERNLAEHWKMFEGSKSEVKIDYPKTYSLKSDEDRLREAERMIKLSYAVPSERFNRELQKDIARLLLANLPKSQMDEIERQIEESETTLVDPDLLLSSFKQGLIDSVTTLKGLGFTNAEEVSELAKEDRAERAALIVEAQGGQTGANRGTPEMGDDQVDEKEGKQKRGKEDPENMGRDQ